MSHDADKLIRQLSLVAFLMAERRPLTARDVKGNVEGYSEMSDEAFARRFYSDRAELTALGVPLNSQRDEFTGEELYTLRSENYFLDQLDLDEDELAALQTALYALEGKFAYAEPLRLALQNLALGRPGFRHAPTATAERVRVTAPDYSPELAARLSKLESAISKQRTIQFRYWSPARDRETERRLNPYALRLDEGVWYVVGHDLDRDATRTFRVARIRSDIRFATRRERDFRLPAEFDVEAHRDRAAMADRAAGRRRADRRPGRHRMVGRSARLPTPARSSTASSRPSYAPLEPLASWILRQNGRAMPLEPVELRDAVREALVSYSRARTRARRPCARASAARLAPRHRAASAGPVAPERFGVLQALLAHLLAACGEEQSAALDADDLAERFSIPREELQDHLSLLNLVNFGGGCYTVYAESTRTTNVVRVDKELYGDVFRRPPKLTPLEARAIRLAIEYVGPTIAAEANTPLERVRAKARGDLRPVRARADARRRASPTTRRISSRRSPDGAEKRRVVEIEYLKEGEEEPATGLWSRTHRARAAVLARAPWDRTVDGPRTYRLDRMRSARLTRERFEPRESFDPNYLARARRRAPLALAVIARWKLERGARRLTDKLRSRTSRSRPRSGSSPRCSPTGARPAVLEPASMRRAVAARAKALAVGARPQPQAEADGRDSLNAPGPASGTSSREPPCALGDRARDPEPDPGRACAAHAAREQIEVGSTPGPSSTTSTTTRPSLSPTSTTTRDPCRSPFATRFASA